MTPTESSIAESSVVVSFGSGTGGTSVNGHGQDGRATANDTTSESSIALTVGRGGDILPGRALGAEFILPICDGLVIPPPTFAPFPRASI
jgi:hypothetical protein